MLASCAAPGDEEAAVADSVEEAAHPSVSAGTELLANGSFRSGLTAWSTYINSEVFVLGGKRRSASAAFTPTTNPRGSYLRNVIRNGGRARWHVQMHQPVRVRSGQSYTIAVDVQGSLADFEIAIEDRGDFHTLPGSTALISPTKGRRTFFHNFVASQTLDNARLVLRLGTTDDYIDRGETQPFSGVRFVDFHAVSLRTASSTADTTAPSIRSLGLGTVAGARALPVAIAASDNTGVTGYVLVDSDPSGPVPSMPALTNPAWQPEPPRSAQLTTTLTLGTRRLTAWVRDRAGLTASRSETLPLGDLYEPDNTRASARAFALGAPAQHRSLHAAGDQDWLSFPVRTGVTYTVSARSDALPSTAVAVFVGSSTTPLEPSMSSTVSFTSSSSTTATVRVSAGAAVGVYTLSITATTQTQLFANSSFDSGLTGWRTIVTNPAEDAILAEGGAIRFKVDGAVNQPWNVQLSQTFAVNAGETFSLSVSAFTTGGGTRAVQLLMQQDGGQRSTYGFAAPTIDGTPRTIRLDNVTIPTSGTVKFAVQGGDNNLDFRVDNAALVRRGSAEPFPGRGPAISSTLVGQNFWHTGAFFSLGQHARSAGVQLIRIGGIWVDREPPPQAEYLRMIDYVRSLGAEPLVQVSRVGSASAAANLVRFVNVDNDRAVRSWAIGNEPNEDETPLATVEAYIKGHAQAMRDVDSNLTIYTLGNSYAEDGYYAPFLGGQYDITGRDAKGRFFVDGIALNHYPFGDQFVRADAETAAWKLGGDVSKLKRWLATANQKNGRTGASALKWALTEFNMTYRNPSTNTVDSIANRSFLDGQFIAETFSIGMKESATTLTPWSLFESEGAGGPFDIGFLEGPMSGAGWRSSMHHLKLIADHFRGHAPPTQSSEPLVVAFAAEDTGGVALAILNKDNTRAFDYGIALGGQAAARRAVQIWVDSLRTGVHAGQIAPATTQIILFDTTGRARTLVEYSVNDARAFTAPRIQTL